MEFKDRKMMLNWDAGVLEVMFLLFSKSSPWYYRGGFLMSLVEFSCCVVTQVIRMTPKIGSIL